MEVYVKFMEFFRLWQNDKMLNSSPCLKNSF